MPTFDLMPWGGMVLTAHDYCIKRVNRKLLEMLGYSEAYFNNEILDSLSLWVNKPAVKSFLHSSHPLKIDVEVYDVNNHHKYITLTRASDRDLIYVFVQDASYTAELITELTEVKRNLAEAQRLAKLGFWERDLQTGELRWSQNMEGIYGLALPTTEEIKSLIHPDDLPKFEKRIKAAVRSEERRVR